jgi:hypothetical protein
VHVVEVLSQVSGVPTQTVIAVRLSRFVFLLHPPLLMHTTMHPKSNAGLFLFQPYDVRCTRNPSKPNPVKKSCPKSTGVKNRQKTSETPCFYLPSLFTIAEFNPVHLEEVEVDSPMR